MDFGFYLIHSLAGRSHWGDLLIIFFAEYFPFVVIVGFIFLALNCWRHQEKRNALSYAVAILAGFIGRFGIAEAIRFFYHHPRPFVALHTSHLLTENSYSFPSGHTIFFFALATATYFFNKKLSYFLFGSGLIIGLARVAAGVHYPADIAGGIVFGILTGAAVYKLWTRLMPSQR
jgi:undecaprenyl-diphosphatase